MDHGQDDVFGKSCIQRRGHGISPGKNFGPEQNQCPTGYGGGPDRRENNYPSPDEATCAFAYCHKFLHLQEPVRYLFL